MPRRSVKFCIGEYYHIYNRGHNRSKIFFEPDHYGFFLKKVRQFLLVPSAADATNEKQPELAASPQNPVDCSESGCCKIISYCLMPNHYHFLIRIERDGFSAAMQSFGQSYTNAINKRLERVGPLFQNRFRAVHVDNEDYLLHLTRYIHLNPFVVSLVSRVQDWQYSSYPEFVGIRNGTIPSPAVILKVFETRAKYRSFVESGILNPDDSISHLLIDG